MTVKEQKFLSEINFSELLLWDVKRLSLTKVSSKYDVVFLGDVVFERSEKVNLFDFLEKEFGILGVNNKIGLFDAYNEFGKNINQAYKKVYNGDLTYNPYRINVGSIGLKTDKQKNNFISPAYVVFTPDQKKLSPEFLYIIFKTNIFGNLINENTTGSVRQNLKYSTLAQIKIPLPSLSEQKKIVENYNQKIKEAEEAEKKSEELEKNIEKYLMEELGIEGVEKEKKKKGLQEVNFKELDRWDMFKSLSSGRSLKYENCNFKNILLKDPVYGANVKGVKKHSNTRYIRITDIKEDGTLNNEFVSPEKVEEKFILKKNDFLIARSGNTVGKTFLYEEKYGRCMYAGYLVKYELDTEKIIPEFMLIYSKSSNYKKWINANQRIAGQPNINGQEYLYSPIILPPLSIQEKIVEKISFMKKEIKELKKLAEENRKNAILEFEKEIFSE